MIKNILKIGAMLVIAVIGYNYFLGSAEEKESSKKIVAGVKEVGKSIGGVIKSETEKFSEGKMDRVIDDLSASLDKIRGKADDNPGVTERASKLDDMLRLLREEMKVLKEEEGTEGKERRALRKRIGQIESEIQKLATEVGLAGPEGE